MRRTKMFFAVALAAAMITGSTVGVAAVPSIKTENVLTVKSTETTTVTTVKADAESIDKDTDFAEPQKDTLKEMCETTTSEAFLEVAAAKAVDEENQKKLDDLKSEGAVVLSEELVKAESTEAGVFEVEAKLPEGMKKVAFVNTDEEGKTSVYECKITGETATIETGDDTTKLAGFFVGVPEE